MNEILGLREKRAKAWDAAKAFLDTKRAPDGLISVEDNATYEKMEAVVVSLGKEIDRLERQKFLDLELSKPLSAPITGRPAVPGSEKTGRASDEYKNAFWKAMRNKNHFDVQNALQIGTDSEGGYLIPDEFERTLVEALQEENIFRQLANIITTSSGDRKIPVVASKGAAAWVDEEGLIGDSDDAFDQVTIGAFKLATMIKVSEELLNDSVFNLESYIAREFGRRIGTKEEEAFFIGDASGKPTGILHTSGGAAVGITAASSTAITMDEVIDLYYALKAPYRRKAVFVMNDATVKAIRKLKDGQGQYLWQPSVQAGTRYSPIAMAKNAIGMAIATEEYGATFFANGANPGGVLEHPGVVKDPKRVRESWNDLFQGSKNAHRVAVLEEGMTFRTIGIPPDQAQFLETRKFQTEEICRIFRIPPHLVADLDKATFSNIEHQSISFIDNTIVPWVCRWEQTMQLSLLTPSEKSQILIKFNLNGRLRGDAASRAAFYQTMRQNGIMSANDIRELEEMNLIPDEQGGSKYLVNGNFVDMSAAGIWTEKYKTGGKET